MQARKSVAAAVVVLLIGSWGSAVAQQVFIDEPWLNWDFLTPGSTNVDGFAVVLAEPDFIPLETYTSVSSWTANRATGEYYASHDGEETLLWWEGGEVASGQMVHVGADMTGSGTILDAYWRKAGNRVGMTVPMVYELTRMTIPPEPDEPWLAMRLSFPEGPYYMMYPNAQVGLRNIRTFADIPGSLLSLDDLTRDLNLAALASFETVPREEDPDGPPIVADQPYWVESFFDVFVDVPAYVSPSYESLLWAEVVVDYTGDDSVDDVIGQFWNLNSQVPEPSGGLLALLACVGLAVRRRPRR